MEIGKLIDDFVAVFSPETAVKRRNWRNTYHAYVAAELTRKDLPFAPDGRAESIDASDRDIIRARVRNLERNSDVISSLMWALENNVVGSQINMQAASKNEVFNARIEELFNDWQLSENCDVTEQQNFTELSKLCLRRMLIDGGVFSVATFDKVNNKYGLKLQIREVDELSTYSEAGLDNNNAVINGVEMTAVGKPVAYHFNKVYLSGIGIDSTPERIPAERVEFLWARIRPTQYREISPLAKSVPRINDLDEYTEAVAFQQKTNACNIAFVETDNYGATAGRAVNTNDGRRVKDLHAGSITYLKPGEKIKPFIPAGQAAEMDSFVVTMLRTISAGQGLSLESATRNVERVNYSSARQNMLADEKTYNALSKFMIEHFWRKVYRRFINACWAMGYLDKTGFNPNDPDYYKAKWLTEGIPWIDPLKEAKADGEKLANGGISFQKYCADHGADWREQIQAMKEVQDYCEKLGVKLNFIASTEAIVANMDDGGDEEDGGENQKSGAKNSGA